MWPDNAVTERLGIAVPIIQAPMAGAATPALAAGAAAAGALGSLGLGTATPEAAARQIQGFRQMSDRPLNANFFVHDAPGDVTGSAGTMRARLAGYYAERGLGAVPPPGVPYGPFGPAALALIEAHRPEVVSFHFGLPDAAALARVKATGAVVLSSATTVAEACWLEAHGADMVIAQGLEAGGHRGTFLGAPVGDQPGLFALLPQVAAAVSVPVIAAGGVVDARTIAAALMLGARAVQMGTAFLRCPEASVAPAHRAALAAARDDNTRATRLFSGRPARGIVNRLVADLADLEDQAAPYPAQLSLVSPLKTGAPDAAVADFAALWSGQSAALTRALPAGDLVRALVAETTERLRAVAG